MFIYSTCSKYFSIAHAQNNLKYFQILQCLDPRNTMDFIDQWFEHTIKNHFEAAKQYVYENRSKVFAIKDFDRNKRRKRNPTLCIIIIIKTIWSFAMWHKHDNISKVVLSCVSWAERETTVLCNNGGIICPRHQKCFCKK